MTAELAGKAIRLTGWICLSALMILWLVVPLAKGLINLTTTEEAILAIRQVIWGTEGEALLKILLGIVISSAIIKSGGYLCQYELREKTELAERILGYLKLSGRIDMNSLAMKTGTSTTELVRILSTIRQDRDVVFFIDNNEVYMPGYERERPKEVIREIVKEVVKIPCSHCGTLTDPNVEKCSNCGSPLKV